MFIKYLTNRYIRMLKREKMHKEKTIVSYESDLATFVKDIGPEKDISTFTENEIDRYFRKLELSNLSESTISRKACTIRQFFRFLEQENLISRSPARKLVLKFHAKKVHPNIMHQKDIDRFFSVIQQEYDSLVEFAKIRQDRGDPDRFIQHQIFCNIRNCLMFQLIAKSGLKPGEISNLKTDHIKIKTKSAAILIHSKGKRFLEIRETDTLRLLKKYRRFNKISGFSSPYFFLNKNKRQISTVMIQKIFKKYLKKASIKKQLTPFSLRHAYAINLIQNGVDLHTIRDTLGYKTFEGMLIYHAYFKTGKVKKMNE